MKTSQRLNLRQHSRWIQLTFCLFLIFTFTTTTLFGQVRAKEADGEMGLETNPVLQNENGKSTYEDISQPEVIRPLAGIQHEPIGVDEQVLNNQSMQDAASALFGWTHDGPLDEWEWGKVYNSRIKGIEGNDRGYCWGTKMDGDYSPNSNGNLYSPIIPIPGDAISPISVGWYQYYNVDAWNDFAQAHYRCDGGNWIQMDSWTGMEYGVGWQSQSFQTNCGPGQTIELRYRLIADDYDFKVYAGYYIDDVVIIDTAQAVIYAESFEPFGWYTDYGYPDYPDFFADEWEWGTPTYTPGPTGCNNGDYCWGTDLDGVYDQNAKDSLYSPMIDIPATNVQLPIKVNWYQAYYLGENDYFFITKAEAYLTCNGGISWTKMWGNTNTLPVSQPWQAVPSGPYSTTCALGDTLQLRFDLERTTTGYAGYFIDDVSITDSSPAPVTIYYQGFELPAGNQPPVVNAGEDQVITTNTTTSTGTVIDDGLPNPPGTVTSTWSKVSGPGDVQFSNANALNTTATFTTVGIYTLRFTANDGEFVVYDDVQITYTSPPIVDAGPDQTIFTHIATLQGSVEDDGLPEPVTTEWTCVNQQCMHIVSPYELETLVEFTYCGYGTFIFRLTASDGASTVYDEMTLTYSPGNQAPVVNVGEDRYVSTQTTNLTATVTDDGLPDPPGIVTTIWTQISGPATVTFGDASQVNTTVTFPVEGIYVLRLTANDGELEAYDELKITYSTTGYPIARVLPFSMETSLCPSTTQEQTVEICNAGGGFMAWELREEFTIPWLSADETSGTLEIGQCTSVTLTFDSTGLSSGIHNGTLLVDTDDHYQTQVSLPVSLDVVSPLASGVCIAPNAMAVKTCTATTSPILQVCNTSAVTQNWGLDEVPNLTWLVADPSSGTLPAGQCQDVILTFHTSGLTPGSVSGQLNLVNTAAPGTPLGTIPVSLTLPGPKTWTGTAGNTNWNDPANWSPLGVPAVEWPLPWEALTGVDYLLCEGNVIIPTGSSVSLVADPLGETFVHNLTIQSGTSLYGGSGNLHVSGNWANHGTFNGADGTALFNHTTFMSGGGTNYFNNLEIGFLQNLNAGGESFTIHGDLSTRGTFNSGTSSVRFAGSSEQWLNCPNGRISFYDLTVAAHVRVNCLYDPIDVNNALVIESGYSLDLRDRKITSGSWSYIDGEMKNYERFWLTDTNTSQTYLDARGLPAVEISVPEGMDPPNNTYVGIGIGSTNPDYWNCSPQPDAVKRYFAIQPSPSAGYAATLRLHYEDQELNGNDEETLGIMRCDWGQWVGVPGTYSRNTGDNWVQVTDMHLQYSRYMLSDKMPILDNPPESDGTIDEGEYGEGGYENPGGGGGGSSIQAELNQSRSSTTWYATWDVNNFYLAASGGFSPAADALNLFIDFDPIKPVIGGGNEWGSLVAPGMDNIDSQLPFRADFYLYAKDGTIACQRANGSGGWVACSNGGLISAVFGENVTEVSIPWSVITDTAWPASFNWFGYLSSDDGSTSRAFAHAPSENPTQNGASPLDMPIFHYFSVPHVGRYNTTGQFSHKSYTHTGGNLTIGTIDVFDFTLGTPGGKVTRANTADTWTIRRDLVVEAGTLSFGESTTPVEVTGDLRIGSSGELTLSSEEGGIIDLAGNLVNEGVINGHSALVFSGAGTTVTNHGSIDAAQVYFDAEGHQFLYAGSGTWQALTIGNTNTPVVHAEAGMTLTITNLRVNSTLQLSSGDLTLQMPSGSIEVPASGLVASSGRGVLHIQGGPNLNNSPTLQVLGTWTAPLTITGFVRNDGTSTIAGDMTVAAGQLNNPSGTSLTLDGNLTVNNGAFISGTTLNIRGIDKKVINNGSVNTSPSNFNAGGIQHLAGNGHWLNLSIQNKSVLQPAAGMTLSAGNLMIYWGGELALGNSDLSLMRQGGLTLGIRGFNGGKVTSDGGRVLLIGPVNFYNIGTWNAPVVVSSGTVTLFNNANSVLGNDLTINADTTLNIPKGNTLSVSGNVINNGTLEQTSAVGTDNTAFLNISPNYFGVEIDPTGEESMGDTTVRIMGNQFCENADFGVKRCFDILPTTPKTADIKFYFTEVERNGEPLENLLVLHWEEDNWYALNGAHTRGGSGDAQWVSVTGVDAYSPFILASTDPTSVTFLFFTAARTNEAVTLNWETASEIDLLGFNLYRATSPGGERVKLNAEVIPLNGPGGVIGGSYTYIDTDVSSDLTYYYWLEGLDLNSRIKEVVGPVIANVPLTLPYQLFIPILFSGQ